jgi:hypothetical protein
VGIFGTDVHNKLQGEKIYNRMMVILPLSVIKFYYLGNYHEMAIKTTKVSFYTIPQIK